MGKYLKHNIVFFQSVDLVSGDVTHFSHRQLAVYVSIAM